MQKSFDAFTKLLISAMVRQMIILEKERKKNDGQT